MNPKKYYETPSVEIIVFHGTDVLTESLGDDMEPTGVYDPTMEWL